MVTETTKEILHTVCERAMNNNMQVKLFSFSLRLFAAAGLGQSHAIHLHSRQKVMEVGIKKKKKKRLYKSCKLTAALLQPIRIKHTAKSSLESAYRTSKKLAD